MDEGTVHLELGPGTEVPRWEFSINVDGAQPEQAEAIRHRVADLLQRRWDMPAAPPEGAPAQQLAEDGRIHVGVVHPLIDPDRQRELVAAVRTEVDAELDGGTVPGGAPAAPAAQAARWCVCISHIPGNRIVIRPEEIQWFSNGVWVPPSDGRPVWVIAVYLAPGGWGGRGSTARLLLSNGATANPPIPKNQVLVGLANETSWAKEIEAINQCSGRVATVFQGGRNSVPNRMLLERAYCGQGANTIVFNKPGALGVWHAVAHFARFWEAFGGTQADFIWATDW